MEVCKILKFVQRLAKEKELLNTIDYQFLYDAFQDDKAYRKSMKAAERGVVRPEMMSEREYYI